jgi:hypothetical protein
MVQQVLNKAIPVAWEGVQGMLFIRQFIQPWCLSLIADRMNLKFGVKQPLIRYQVGTDLGVPQPFITKIIM